MSRSAIVARPFRMASSNCLALPRARPQLHRTRRQPGADPVVLLSHEVWSRRYNQDASVIGRIVDLSGHPATIIGVMPPRFAFPETQQVWLPLSAVSGAMVREARWMQVFGRLRPGVSIDQAQSEVSAVATRLAASYPKQNDGWSVAVHPLREWMLPAQVELMLFTMMGAVTLVLLIACSNVANLLLARASVRHREISIRAALGAGQMAHRAAAAHRSHAHRPDQCAARRARRLGRRSPARSRGAGRIRIPYFIHWSLDGRALIYTIGISLVTGIVFGLAPALQAARTNLQDSLKDGARGASGGSARVSATAWSSSKSRSRSCCSSAHRCSCAVFSICSRHRSASTPRR